MLELMNIIRKECTLTEEENIFAKLFENMHTDLINYVTNCPFYLIPLNSVGAGCVTYSFLESIEWMRFESVNDYAVYLKKLKCFHRQTEDIIDSMREGIRRGFTCSVDVCHDIVDQLDEIIEGDLDELNEPITSTKSQEILKDTPELLAELKAGVTNTKLSFAYFKDFFVTEYTQHLRTNPACSSLPGGKDIYDQCLKYHTTTDLTSDEVHNIGLSEVAKIEQRYKEEVLKPLGFKSDDFAGFVEHARTDPKFYVKTSEELLEIYRKQCNLIHEVMPKFFNKTPRSPMEITSKNAGPAAYYLAGTADGTRPGRFYVNTSHIEKRPVYESVSLALHEAIPGHHHQLSLALENESVPKFIRFIEDRRYECCPCRRNLYTGYAEGWGLYSEFLGEEMEMYKTPYDIFGYLSMNMMRAVRCVVDTGLHSKGWSIEKTISYMMEKTGMHLHEVETEIYRYAAWPGQACAYKVGQLEFLRLRAHAESNLGDKFDVREFHEICLGSGALPLTLLTGMVEKYISENL
jgi:uncharacterized protein (DUF885 family)